MQRTLAAERTQEQAKLARRSPLGYGEPSGIHSTQQQLLTQGQELLRATRYICTLLAVIFTSLSIISFFVNFNEIESKTSALGVLGFAFGMIAVVIKLKANQNKGVMNPKED
ncbi:hypothetical protein [Solwaraspora sp. WMMA2101]|uniref:hypothetical protein n=1 Tax=Solwaraspora sp. WMMA2101 TaxID=3404124 RepID=UPI003B9500D9